MIGIATSLPELPASDEALCRALNAYPFIWSSRHWLRYDTIIVRSCWDYHLRLPEFLSWISEVEQSGRRLINSPDLIRWNANKLYLKDLDIPIPETEWIEGSVNLADLCRRRGWPQAVVKPLVSASAHGTILANSGTFTGPLMAQEYVNEIETEGEWSLIFISGEFSHAIRKRPGPNDFRVQHEYGGSATLEDPPGGALSLARSALALLPMPATLARVDVIAHRAAYALMELEIIEPELFLELAPGSAGRAAEAILSLL